MDTVAEEQPSWGLCNVWSPTISSLKECYTAFARALASPQAPASLRAMSALVRVDAVGTLDDAYRLVPCRRCSWR